MFIDAYAGVITPSQLRRFFCLQTKSYQSTILMTNCCQFSVKRWDKDSRELFFECLATKLRLETMTDWYKITKRDVTEYGGREMLQKYYGGSVARAIQKIFLNHEWKPWKFNDHAWRDMWEDVSLQRTFVDELAVALNIATMDDWYAVTQAQICDHGGGGLISKYNSSPSKMITSILTEHTWELQRFLHSPKGMLEEVRSQRELLNSIGQKLCIKSMEDWYNVTGSEIREHGGKGLLQKYRNSSSRMITSVFSDHKWNLLQFRPIRKNVQDKTTARRKILQHVAKELKMDRMEDWYAVTRSQIRERGGGRLLRQYSSIADMVASIFTEHHWDLHKFTKRKGVWSTLRSQRDGVRLFAKELNTNKIEDWYAVKRSQIRKLGGRGLLRKYGSPFKMVTTVLTNADKTIVGVPKRDWSSIQEQQQTMDHLAKELKITNMDDWYKVTAAQICEKGARGLLRKYLSSPAKMVTSTLTNHHWDLDRFRSKIVE